MREWCVFFFWSFMVLQDTSVGLQLISWRRTNREDSDRSRKPTFQRRVERLSVEADRVAIALARVLFKSSGSHLVVGRYPFEEVRGREGRGREREWEERGERGEQRDERRERREKREKREKRESREKREKRETGQERTERRGDK